LDTKLAVELVVAKGDKLVDRFRLMLLLSNSQTMLLMVIMMSSRREAVVEEVVMAQDLVVVDATTRETQCGCISHWDELWNR
jgi:hypothetical protein